MIPSEEDLVREPLLGELYLWPPPASIPTKSPPRRPLSCTANTGRTTSSFDVSRFELLDEPDGEGKSGNSEDAGTEETKGEPSSGQRTGEGITSTAKKRNGNGNENGNVWAGKKRRCIAARLEVLYTLNKKLRDALPYVDLSQVGQVSEPFLRCLTEQPSFANVFIGFGDWRVLKASCVAGLSTNFAGFKGARMGL